MLNNTCNMKFEETLIFLSHSFYPNLLQLAQYEIIKALSHDLAAFLVACAFGFLYLYECLCRDQTHGNKKKC